MAEREASKVIPGPSFYKVEELGSYVDAAAPVLEDDPNNDSALSGMSMRYGKNNQIDLCLIECRSSLESVDSELYQHIEENGRTYHRYKMGQYPLPNDMVCMSGSASN
ncbi:hypothetical protein ACMFMF_003277 [Clarireedia jacksonii]